MNKIYIYKGIVILFTKFETIKDFWIGGCFLRKIQRLHVLIRLGCCTRFLQTVSETTLNL